MTTSLVMMVMMVMMASLMRVIIMIQISSSLQQILYVFMKLYNILGLDCYNEILSNYSQNSACKVIEGNKHAREEIHKGREEQRKGCAGELCRVRDM